jgi:hypothetical protein
MRRTSAPGNHIEAALLRMSVLAIESVLWFGYHLCKSD